MDRRKMTGWRMALSAAMVTAGFALCICLSHLICAWIFRLTGTPSALWEHIIIGVLALYFAFGIVKVGAELYNDYYGRHDDYRHRLLDETLAALNRIASGDFSVMLETREHDPLSGLAESVNKMARELGTMENLRQDFISNVSHEIQSPLTSISGFAALMKNDALSPEERAHYLDVIETEARRLSKLSDNLLRLSALQSNAQPLTVSAFRLDKQIQNAALMLEPQWVEKQIDLSLHLEKIDYSGDEGLLTQVWINLLHNAIKFTPDGGSIDVSCAQAGAGGIVRIADTGAGIADEDKKRIFERFYKADKARDRSLGGNGLGLSLVKKIVELHGGAIRAESELGKGATFTVKLPAQ